MRSWGVVSIADTGIGIPPEERPRVWDRLFRGDRSRTERGLGLGLSLVKAVVEAHGGEVRLESEVGVGSTFEVRLPRAPNVTLERQRAELTPSSVRQDQRRSGGSTSLAAGEITSARSSPSESRPRERAFPPARPMSAM